MLTIVRKTFVNTCLLLALHYPLDLSWCEQRGSPKDLQIMWNSADVCFQCFWICRWDSKWVLRKIGQRSYIHLHFHLLAAICRKLFRPERLEELSHYQSFHQCPNRSLQLSCISHSVPFEAPIWTILMETESILQTDLLFLFCNQCMSSYISSFYQQLKQR